MTTRLTLATPAAIAAALVLLVGLPAQAESALDPAISCALAATPGGQIVDERTVFWPDLDMTLTIPDPRVRGAIGTCPSGAVCAFSSDTLKGLRLSWTTCGTHSTNALTTVGSIANARATETLLARYGTTVRATSGAQTWVNVSGAVDNIYCWSGGAV